MALELDIRANDEMEKSALAAADALDKVADAEREVDAVAKQISSSYKKAAIDAAALAKYAAVYGQERQVDYGQSKKIAEIGTKDRSKIIAQYGKDYNATKKRLGDGKKFNALLHDAAAGAKVLGASLVVGATAVAALATGLAAAAKSAYDTRRDSAALVNAFTAGQGPKVLKQLDSLAVKLGESIDVTRSKFVEFRQAGFQSQQSAALIKMRADLRAVGLSAESADKEIGYVLAKADGRGNIAAMRQLAEISRVYGGIGSGAAAAARANSTLESAMAKVDNAGTAALASFWKEIGPSIGLAANRAADFAIKLLESKEGKAAIEGIAASFNKLSGAVNAENMTKILKGVETALWLVDAAFKAISFDVDGLGKKFESAFKPLEKWLSGNTDKKSTTAGESVVGGFVKGIDRMIGVGDKAVVNFAGAVSDAFTNALGIHSPSKLFADYGRQTVEGYELGQQSAIGPMPLQAAATQRPARGSGGSSTGGSIVIEQLIVQGGGDANAIGRSIKEQLQLLLQAGALSRGIT